MIGEDSPREEYSRIIAEIRNQLDGDLEHDGPLLMKYADEYRDHPLAQEVIREIGRMLFAALPPDAKSDTEKTIDEVYGPINAGLSHAAKQLSSGDASGARRTLEEIIAYFDTRGDMCRDDAVSEYRMFRNPYQAVLYHKLFKPTREVRKLPYDLASLYWLYGTTLVELGDLNAAETALRHARSFSPVDPAVLFELGEVLKMQRRWQEHLELSLFALSVSFSAEQAARAYRNLGYYFIEQNMYEAADACYKKSALIDDQSGPRCTNELMYIAQRTGKPVRPSEPMAVDQVLLSHGVQIGMTEVVRDTIGEVDGSFR